MKAETRARAERLFYTMAEDLARLSKELSTHAEQIADPVHDKLIHPDRQVKQVLRKLNNISMGMYHEGIADILSDHQ